MIPTGRPRQTVLLPACVALSLVLLTTNLDRLSAQQALPVGVSSQAGEIGFAAPIVVLASGIDEFTRTGVVERRSHQQDLQALQATVVVTYKRLLRTGRGRISVRGQHLGIADLVAGSHTGHRQLDSSLTGVLGSAGPGYLLRNFPGAPRSGVFYPAALANKFAGSDLSASADLTANFNSTYANWYFGTTATHRGPVRLCVGRHARAGTRARIRRFGKSHELGRAPGARRGSRSSTTRQS